MLWRHHFAVFLILCTQFYGCGGGVVTHLDGPPPAPPGTRPIQIEVTPPDAGLWVDGVYRGTVDRYRDGWFALDRKARTLELRMAGYYRVYRLVVPDLEKLSVKLLKVPQIQ